MFVRFTNSLVSSPCGTTASEPWLPPFSAAEIRQVQLNALRAKTTRNEACRRTERKLANLMQTYRRVSGTRGGSGAPRLQARSVGEAQRIVDNLRAREIALGVRNHQHEARIAAATLGRLGLPVVIGL